MKKAQRGNKWVILFIIVMFPLMTAIDATIVNVALPVLSDELGVSTSKVAWVASIYLLGQVATMLFFGRLGDIQGQMRIFQAGVVLFTLGSLFCSLSNTFGTLLFSRVVQSLGASATLSNTHAIITSTFGDAGERGRALGVNSAFVALGTLIGPALGGFILSVSHWHTLFWINLPAGVAVFAAGALFFPPARGSGRKLDVPGGVLFALSMLSLFFVLQEAQALGAGSPLIIGLAALCVISFALFLYQQRRAPHPLLQLNIFRNTWFSVSLFCAFASYVSISCYNLVQPFYLEDLRALPPAFAGLLLSIYPFVIVLVSPLSGTLCSRIRAERLTVAGLGLTAAGLFLMSLLGERTSFYVMAVFIMTMAAGNGLFQAPNNVIVMSSLPGEHLGVGGSMNALVRTAGQSMGIVVSNALLYGGMSAYLGRPVTDFVPGESGAFLLGMRHAYLAAMCVCLAGLLATVFRLAYKKRQEAA